MYQRFSNARQSFDTLVSKRLKSSKDQDVATANFEPEEQQNDNVEKSLPPKPKSAQLRRQSAVHSLLRRVHSHEILNRFSASFATYHGRPVSPASISAPFDFTHVQTSKPLPPTPTSSPSGYPEAQPSFGSSWHQCKTRQDTPEPPSPVWVAVDCERCNEPHQPKSLACKRTAIPAWPFEHPHPLRSNPWEASRSSGLPSAFKNGRPWQNRRVSFLSNEVKS